MTSENSDRSTPDPSEARDEPGTAPGEPGTASSAPGEASGSDEASSRPDPAPGGLAAAPGESDPASGGPADLPGAGAAPTAVMPAVPDAPVPDIPVADIPVADRPAPGSPAPPASSVSPEAPAIPPQWETRADPGWRASPGPAWETRVDSPGQANSAPPQEASPTAAQDSPGSPPWQAAPPAVPPPWEPPSPWDSTAARATPPPGPDPVPEPDPVLVPGPAAGAPEPEEPDAGRRVLGQAGGQPVYHTSSVYGAQAKQSHRRRGRRTLILAGTSGVLAVALVAVLLVVVVFKPGSAAKPKYGLVPTGSSAQQDAQQVAAAFLTAWKSRDLTTAANYTDDPAAAQTGLATYAKDLNLTKFSVKTSSAAAATGSSAVKPRETVTFAVSASVAAGSGDSAVRATWAYHSSLVAYQKADSDVWLVAWAPDVVAPGVTAGEHLAAFTVSPTVSEVTDADGKNLTKYADAGLDTIAGIMKTSASSSEGAQAGLDVQIQTKAGKAVAGSQAILISPGNYPTVSTTISSSVENAARTAVKAHAESSMVVLQPSTGHILAIANNAQDNDFALTASVAPGSTMKTITSTALFNAGLVTPSTGVACPAALTVTGITYHNDENESEPAGTPFSDDFAQSCNNAFTQWWPHLYGKLASTAKDYYGLNQNWDIGIGGDSASYFHAPATAVNSELAQEAFGEGSLTASPLAMASVAATIDSGQFKQPVLTLSAKQSVTAKALPSSTDTYLKELMRDVVTEGTAAGIGLGSGVYAKTGTADITGQDQPNSWMIAFNPSKDVAVACLVVNAGYGASIAGPEVVTLLKALGAAG